MGDVKILNRTTGKLETLPVEEADRKVATQAGFDYPSLDELERHERLEKYGDQQGTAVAETLGRTATFGAFQGFGSQADIEGRRRTLAEESPGVQFAAQAIGSTLPALATGGVATGAVGALGLGARAATAASVIAEGASGGLADEIEQAALDQRPVSAGRAMLVGVGGELIGRAIPAAVKAGIAGLRGAPAATAAVAGEAVEDLTEAAAKKADTRLADAAPHMPPGPERDAALAATAETQRARATEQMGGAAERAAGLVQEIADDAPKKLAKEIEGTSPSQIRWAAEMAGQLRTIAETAPETHAAMLRESAQALLDAKNGKAIWSAAADARKRIREVAATEGAAERARKIADRMRARDKQAGAVRFSQPSEDIEAKTWVAVGKRAQQNVDPETAEALKVYSESGHQGTNALLRNVQGRRVANDQYFRDLSGKVTKYLDDQVAAGNAVPGTVYRGIKAEHFPAKLSPGQEWSDAGILSTTRDRTQAQNFGGEVLLEVEQTTGVPFLRKDLGNKINHEQEVLIRPGTKFEVVSDGQKKLPNRQLRRTVRLREKPAGAPLAEVGETVGAPFKAPLDDVRTGGGGQTIEMLPGESAIRERMNAAEKAADFTAFKKARAELKALQAGGGTASVGGPVDYTARQTQKAAGATPGGMFTGSDGKERYIKFIRSEELALSEAANSHAYADFGVGTLPLRTAKRGSETMVMSDRLGGEWQTLDAHMASASPNPELAHEYVAGVPADFVLGNWDVATNGGNVMTDGQRMIRIDSGEAGPNSLTGNAVFDPKEEWGRFRSSFYEANRRNVADNPRSVRGPVDMAAVHGKTFDEMRAAFKEGIEKVSDAFRRAGGTKKWVASRYGHLVPEEQAEFAKQLDKRLRFLRKNQDGFVSVMASPGHMRGALGRVPWRDIAASPLGNVVGAGAGAALGGQAGGQEGAALGGLAGFAASLLLARGRGAGRGLGRALARAGERGSVTIGGEVANDVGAAGLKRTMAGARVLEHDFAKGAPDFSDWDPSDFGRGRGGSHAAGKHAADYSGGETLSTYQRSIVDGLKKNAGFAENGRVTGDAGKLGSEPTFHLQADGSVKLVHGRLRLTAARELGRDTVYGRVVKGKGKEPTLAYEGPIKVGGGPRAVGDAPPAPAAPGQPPQTEPGMRWTQTAPGESVDEFLARQRAMRGESPAEPAPAAKPPIVQADELLSGGQKAVDVWGRAGQGAADLDRAVAPGPGPSSHVDTLEDVTAAAERWKVGSDKARSGLADESRAMREADSLHADVDRAEAGKGAFRGLAGAAAGELAEYAVERAVGAAVPGAGLALRGAKYLWRKLDDSAKAQIARTARTLMSPLTSSGRWGAARSATAMTALDRFKGDAPDARSAFEARKEMLQSAAASPQVAGQAMAQALAGLARESPNNFVMLARRMHESLQYVSQNLPATVGISLAHPTGVPITDGELRDVADLWNTAFDPSSAFDDIARCEASPVQMRTLKELHPDIYAELQQSIVAQSPATFAQLDTQTKLSIDIMFGSDGAGGLFASSEAARYVATANKRVPPKPPGGQQLQPGATTDTVESSGVRAVRTGVTNKGAA